MHTIQDNLHASWLSQLRQEYQCICHNYNMFLTMPILAISNSQRCLGTWSDAHRILQISSQLILNHPWHVTLNVLKHEMGHQICAELLGEPGAGHGPIFRRACGMIGLDAAFCLENADSEQGLLLALDPATSRQGRKLVEKVRKLLALGHSDNEHEAALALRCASEILERHRLDMEQLTAQEGFSHLTIDTRQRTIPGYRKRMCNLLQECFGVQVVLSSLYDPLLLRSHKTVELLGRREETAIARHCWYFLENRLASLWQANKSRFQGDARRARNSYFLGVVAGFHESLRASTVAPAVENNTSADPLPMHMDQALSDFVALHYPRLRKSTASAIRLNSRAYNEAVRAGRQLSLRRPVEERQAQKSIHYLPALEKNNCS